MTSPPERPDDDGSRDRTDGRFEDERVEAYPQEDANGQADSSDDSDASRPGADDPESTAADGVAPENAHAETREAGEPRQDATGTGEDEPETADDVAQEERSGEAEQAPRKKMSATLVAGIAAAIVVVLAGGGVAAFFVFVGGDSAKEVAERYVAVATRETQDPGSVTAADYRPIVCRESMPQIEKMQKRKEQVLKSVSPADLERVKKVTTTLTKVDTSGDTGKATFETAFPGKPPQSAELQLIKEDGGWQLCG